jgi:hypothetical protein
MRCERSIGQEPVRADSGVREVENKYLPSQSASSMPAKRNEKGVFFYSGLGDSSASATDASSVR